MSDLEDLIIEVDVNTDEQHFPSTVDEGAYVHTVIEGKRIAVPTRAFTLPPEARNNFPRGETVLLSALPQEIRRSVLDALKGPEAARRERQLVYGEWTY